mmetsp:Transcript_130330/g.418117  ORF Transcript_130330/g.418117 Transcript_130330/m.418117 type:complete len:115 (+) Transcript_130330:86-430(+)
MPRRNRARAVALAVAAGACVALQPSLWIDSPNVHSAFALPVKEVQAPEAKSSVIAASASAGGTRPPPSLKELVGVPLRQVENGVLVGGPDVAARFASELWAETGVVIHVVRRAG